MTAEASIYDISYVALRQLMEAWQEPPYRADQIWHGLFRQLVFSPDLWSNLPVSLATRLQETFIFESLTLEAHQYSQDCQTEKVLFRTATDHRIETVLMRYLKRNTICISTQSGCPIGCVFCATGQMGFHRNLTAGEIIEQVLFLARQLAQTQERITNIVVMGMGEPFLNYDATMEALDRLNHPKGYRFGARRMTVSTIGIPNAIDRFTSENRQINLAVSLHAATDELRQQLIPISNQYPLENLLIACRRYSQETGRRITFEWALVKGVNDSNEQAEALIQRIQGMLCHVNLIPLNPTPGFSGQASSKHEAQRFCGALRSHGISCTIRIGRGIDIQAGCGQLATQA